jgi:hypothetical protein
MGCSRLLTRITGLAALGVALGLGCASVVHGPTTYEFFSAPRPDDPWTPKIASWQTRELASSAAETPASVSGAGEAADEAPRTEPGLRGKYTSFRTEHKRALARDLAGWIQKQARRHYVPDGPIDHWATLEETLEKGAEDCDGLELLSYHFLRDLGFREDEVFRAIVYRRQDGQHHMVTLWFEDASDPWVIDPTGAMTSGMPRLSQVGDWVPLKVFSDTSEVGDWVPLKVFSDTSEFTPRATDPSSRIASR